MVQVRSGERTEQLTWEEWEERVRTGRVGPDVEVRIGALTGAAWVRAAELEVWSALRNDAGTAFRAAFSRGIAPVATALLVGVQIRIWWLGWLPPVFAETERWLPKLTTAILENGESWRLFTMGFYHESVLHIALNLLWLAYAGWSLERALGRANLVTLYLSSVLGGSVLSMVGSPDRPAIGASGGIFGLIAAVTVFGLLRPELLSDRSRRLFGPAILPYLILMFASGLQNATTDNWAHFGGLVTGGLLASFLDPPGLQRRPGWNRGVQATAAGVCLLVPMVLAGAGPRLHWLRDADAAAAAFADAPEPQPEPDRGGAPSEAGRYRALRWKVPIGWAPASLATFDLGVASTAGERGFAVTEKLGELPITPDQVLETWLGRARDTAPDATASLPHDVTFAGLPGREFEVQLGKDPALLAVVTAATRGAWSLTATWIVEAEMRTRLLPLELRSRRSVTWGEPEALVQARRDASGLGADRPPRIALARQRILAGELTAGQAELAALTAERPTDAAAWLARIEFVHWDPSTGPVIWDEALAALPEPKLIGAVVSSLARSGRTATARGLAEVAWLRLPGDRLLARARRSQGLPTALENGLPVELVREGQRDRSADEIASWRSWPLDLAGAEAAGAVLAGEDAAANAEIRAAIPSGPEVAVPLLIRMKYGPLQVFPEDAANGLAEDFLSLEGPNPPSWLPAELRVELARDPLLAAWARAVADARSGG